MRLSLLFVVVLSAACGSASPDQPDAADMARTADLAPSHCEDQPAHTCPPGQVCTIGVYEMLCAPSCGGLGEPCCAIGKDECTTGICTDVGDGLKCYRDADGGI